MFLLLELVCGLILWKLLVCRLRLFSFLLVMVKLVKLEGRVWLLI